jgi:hypothetical protein
MKPLIHRFLRGVTFKSGESILKLFMELHFLFRRQHFYSSAQEIILVVEKYQRPKAFLSTPRNLLLGGVDC